MESRLKFNAAQGAADNFKLEQEKFLQAQLQFKSGFLYFGQIATGLLVSMFYILPAGRQFAEDELKNTSVGKDFIDACDAFRREIYIYSRRKGVDNLDQTKLFPLTEDYIALDNQYDELVKRFFLIMYKMEFTP